MTEIVRMIIGIGAPFNMMVIALIGVFGIACISTIATELRKYFCHRETLEFKRDLLSQGLSVDDVERMARTSVPSAADKKTHSIA